uniref:Uncharacterized protein n=1 Tax=Craspedostauros australis TaxID=1486917 RepID=A0A7S0F5G5_9STRA|mmetsp:Transcript_6952/g.18864  ORF Transcript_6952/g.18864 Transcript_6952/m.18864 type:complete len:100 (+) Transcript_6952:454-753(+)
MRRKKTRPQRRKDMLVGNSSCVGVAECFETEREGWRICDMVRRRRACVDPRREMHLNSAAMGVLLKDDTDNTLWNKYPRMRNENTRTIAHLQIRTFLSL